MKRSNFAWDLRDFGDVSAMWHRKKHPQATAERIGLKLAEEVGEVVEALLKGHSNKRFEEELADVLICVLVGSYRYGAGRVFELAQKKLEKSLEKME